MATQLQWRCVNPLAEYPDPRWRSRVDYLREFRILVNPSAGTGRPYHLQCLRRDDEGLMHEHDDRQNNVGRVRWFPTLDDAKAHAQLVFAGDAV